MQLSIKVCNKPCNQCLFSDAKIVNDERKQSIINELEAEDGWFICHKSPDNYEGKHMCNGWYTRYKHGGLLKLAVSMGLLKLVEVPKPKY